MFGFVAGFSLGFVAGACAVTLLLLYAVFYGGPPD